MIRKFIYKSFFEERLFLFNIFLVFFSQNTHANNPDFIFENISIEKGLSSRIVFCVTQDKTGFMWFGTDDGLNRYDGYNFRIFKNQPNDSTSISNSTINCSYRTKDNVLWFGTDKGLNIYDPATETFSIPRPENDTHRELATQRIRVMFEDSYNNLWIGTQNGLIKYNRIINEIDVFLFQKYEKNAVLNIIRSIYEDNDGILWVGTFNGLFRLNPQTKDYTHYIIKRSGSNILPNNLIPYIYGKETDNKYIWLGTETGLCKFNKIDGTFEIFHSDNTDLTHSAIKNMCALTPDKLFLATDYGLNLFDLKTNTSIPILHDKLSNLSIYDNVTQYIYKDNSGIFWFGTNNGISKINIHRKKFDINRLKEEQNEIIINHFALTGENQIWFATNKGILRKNNTTNEFKVCLYDSNVTTNKLSRKIIVDKRGIIWIGTNSGLFYWDKKTKIFKKVILKESPLLLKYIFGITEDEYGNIWTTVNNGLCQITPELNTSGEIISFKHEVINIKNPVSHNQNNEIPCIHSDGKNRVWFGISNEGLFNYNFISKKITHFEFKNNDKNSIISNSIINIFSDKNKNTYIITDRGLCQYNDKNNSFQEIYIDNYYRYSFQNGIVDKNNNLWLSSFFHLFYYHIETRKTITFDFTHELKNKGFIRNSIHKSENGTIYLGSYDRYISFNPDRITTSITDSVVNPALITSVKVFEQDVKWGKHTDDENREEKLTLKYNQNFIRIFFSLLNYASPTNNQYSYMLEGVDKNWNTTTGVQNFAAYSNLRPGQYIFLLKGANPDGFWSKNTTQLKIIIAPPWWKSWWAYTIYVIFGLMILYYISKIIRARLVLAQQLKQEKNEREKNEEINLIKLRFFTNISHEFRTPLTLILGPIETLMDKITDPKLTDQLNIMKSNAERLLRLINQIMDFRKIENKKMELNRTTTDLVNFTKSIFNLFKEHALKRNIEFVFDSSCSQCIFSFDNDKIEKVIFNLLSNAFKFTHDHGCVTLSIERKAKENIEIVEFSVADNGIGISENEEELIFERFHQSPTRSIEGVEGTGIGLTLCKEFIEMHNGAISVKNNHENGSVFIFTLPIVDEQIQIADIETETEDLINNVIKQEKEKILIIEDNVEMRTYLRKNLEETYEILEASDGVEGMECVHKALPDIIISDLMMPRMNGLELCDKVKSNMVTNHIPFIILTAKVNEETTFEGYSYGADDYITKPFSLKLLRIRIVNLLEKKQKLQNYYRISLLSEPQQIEVASINEKFIMLLVKAIDENIDNFDLSIELLCNKLNITHQQIYRKLKALTGQTVNEFIRTVRMKRAAQMLINSDLNVSEIMYSVGFSNRSYFSKCFVEEFNMTPKEYRNNSKESSK